MVLQCILTYVSVVVLPIQFLYRYKVLTGSCYTTLQLLRVFIMISTVAILLGGFTVISYDPKSSAYNDILRTSADFRDMQVLPPYAVADAWNNIVVIIHFAAAIVVINVSYISVFYIYLKTNKKFKSIADTLSSQTMKVQKQMARVILIQVCDFI